MQVIRTASHSQSVKGKNMGLMHSNRILRSATAVLSALMFTLAFGGCGKSSQGESTADRIKRVEERQKTDANFHQERSAHKTATSPAVATPAPPATGAVAANQPNAAVR